MPSDWLAVGSRGLCRDFPSHAARTLLERIEAHFKEAEPNGESVAPGLVEEVRTARKVVRAEYVAATLKSKGRVEEQASRSPRSPPPRVCARRALEFAG